MNPYSNVIKSLLAVSGKKQKDLAEFMGMSPQTLTNKFARGSWSIVDLCKVADFCGAVMSFDVNGTKIYMDPATISDNKKESL